MAPQQSLVQIRMLFGTSRGVLSYSSLAIGVSGL